MRNFPQRAICRQALGLLLGLGGWLHAVAADMPATSALTPAIRQRFDQAQALIREGKIDAGIALGLKLVSQAEQETPPNDAAIIAARQELVQLYLLCHKFDDAEKTLQGILQQLERSRGPDDESIADALFDLGWFYSNLSKPAKAEPLFLRALEINERRFGRRHRRTADVLNGLGVLCENKGEYDRAERYFLESIDIKKETLGADALSTANTINNLATLYWSQSDYMRAEKYFAQALAVRERVRGRGSLPTATTVNNLALVYSSMGDYERAEPLFWRVLRIREHKLGVNHPLTLMTVNHLGLLYYDLRDFPAAESFLQRAATGREKSIGLDQPDTARAIFHLACLYDTMGQYTKAEPLHLRALDIRQRVLGEKHPETAASYGFLARHYHLMGQLEKAAPDYQQALDRQKATLGDFHPDLLKTLENFACLQLDRGRRDEAAALAREASEIRARQLRNLFAFTSEKQRIDFQKTLSFYNLPASIGDAEEIARVVYQTKGAVLDSLVEDNRIMLATKDAETAALLDQRRAIERKLESLQNEKEASGISPADRAGQREELEREADRLQSAIGERLNTVGTMRQSLQVTPAAVAAAVPNGAVLVEYVRYNACRKNLKFVSSYGALVQTRGEPPRWVPLGDADEIEKQITLYQKYVRRRVRDAALTPVLKRLCQLLWQPLESSIPSGVRRVILSPDGDVNFLSFATLLTADNRFLCEKLDVEYVSSARDLLTAERELPSGPGTLAVFAAPDFGGAAGKGKGSAIRLPGLPGTRDEAVFLQTEAPVWGWTVQLYTGTEATEAQLRALASPTILHLATHGFYWNSKRSEPQVNSDLPTGMRAVTTANPMKQSLLALAGAQTTLDNWEQGKIADADNDGLLAADEVGLLNLQGTWLVVLSACDTGMGQAQAGEGVLGLRRGFLLAGAQNLLMTLWPVDDADADDFMKAFYRSAIPGRNASAALASVQRERLVKLRQQKGLWPAVRSAGPFILSY